ncbi:MAG TPA: hypothetical protein VMT67_02165 [Terriglobales bacterium]|nr:hypothetical protein [Terriglobales bacterium]
MGKRADVFERTIGKNDAVAVLARFARPQCGDGGIEAAAVLGVHALPEEIERKSGVFRVKAEDDKSLF